MQKYKDTLLSQYANSTSLLALLEGINSCIDPSLNIDAFYNLVWNVETAQGAGLDLWGRIVGVNRVLTIPLVLNFFGFEEAGANTFGQEAFYSPNTTQNYILSDDYFRNVIYAKALSNISRFSIQVYNKMLMQLFPGRGNAYVTDNNDMTATLTFSFALLDYEIALLKQSGIFANPTGVLLKIYDTGGYE